MSGRVPARVDAATKAGLLDLLDDAIEQGWTLRGVCHQLEPAERRAHRWLVRRARGRLVDRAPGGSPMHGLLAAEAEEILALFDEWGETDRSHRKLAHRGSYLHRVWVSPSSVRRVLFLADKHFRPQPRPGKSARKPFPDWVTYTPNSIWIYDTTHFPAAGMAVLIIEDLVSRKWITEIVSVEETSTQVELAFTAALAAEGLLDAVDARHDNDTSLDPDVDDDTRPILLAVSDNGPQMTSGSTREFMALCAIAQHFGRPGTPTDQAWIESLNGHVKIDYPHLLAIRDPRHPARRTHRHQSPLQRRPAPSRNRLRHPRRRTPRTRRNHPQGPPGRPRASPTTPACHPPTTPADSTHPGPRRCWLIQRESASRSQKHVTVPPPPQDPLALDGPAATRPRAGMDQPPRIQVEGRPHRHTPHRRG
jgi:putative transposase